jgi:hypothetical protein
MMNEWVDFMGKEPGEARPFDTREKHIDAGPVLCFHGVMGKKDTWSFRYYLTHGTLGIGALNLLLFADVLFPGGGRILSSPQADLFLHFAAWRQFAFGQLRQGHLVLWNPHYLCGAPFFGGFEAGILYPPNWLYMILPLGPAINIGIVLHVFLGGMFTYLWAARRGLHPTACLLSGTVFMFGGAYFLHVFAGHLPNLCAMVWAPLLFLSLDEWVEDGSWRSIGLGIFALSMQVLAGHPQYVYFTAIIAFPYVLLRMKGNPGKAGIFCGFLAIYTGASLLTAVQLWPGIESFLECGRNIPLEYLSAASFSFPPQNLLTLILPNLFGSLSDGPYWSQWFLWEVSAFIGMTALFLALIAVGSVKPASRPWILTMVCISFFLALGGYTPFYRLLYDLVPFFNGLRGSCKFDFLGSLFIALLAGLGFNHLATTPRPPRWPAWSAAFLGALLSATGLAVLDSTGKGEGGSWGRWFGSIGWLEKAVKAMDPVQRSDFISTAGIHCATSLLWGGATCFLLMGLFFVLGKERKAVHGIAALAILELFLFARSNRPTFDLADLQKKVGQVEAFYARDPGDYRVYGTASISLLTGGYDVWEDEPMVLGRYGRFVCASQGLSENQLFSVLPIFQKFIPSFGLLRLKYILSTEGGELRARPTGFPLLPRMKLIQDYQVVPDAPESLKLLVNPPFDLGQKVLLERPPDPPPALPGTSPVGGNSGTVHWKDLSTDEVEVEAETAGSAILLITDNYSEGWRATALPDSDQKRYSVVPGDYFLQAIPLSAGRHHFRLEYLPPLFNPGKWVSILSCLLYVGILVRHWKSGRSIKRPKRKDP